MGFVGFITSSWVNLDAPWVSLGSSGVAVFIGVRIGGCWVHQWWLDALGYALGVVGFIRGRSVGVVGFVRGCWVHWGAPWESTDSSGVAGLFGVHPAGGRVRPRSLSSLGCAMGSSCSSGIVGFIVVRAVGSRVHLVLLSS